MQIIVNEEDFVATFGSEETRKLKETHREVILGEQENDATNAILDAIPKVLISRFKRMVPPDFEVIEVQLKFNLSGQPFGVGVSGDATVKFVPRAKR